MLFRTRTNNRSGRFTAFRKVWHQKNMKLRLSKNSIRLRLTEQDIEDFRLSGRILEKTVFSAENGLTFSLEKSTVKFISADFSGGKISVFVPETIAENWLKTNEIGFEGEQKIGEDSALKIIVERDLGYKKPRRDKEEAIKLREI